MYSDPIADLLTRIRNASRAGKKTLAAPYSRMKEEILKILEAKGWIEKARVDQTGKFPELRITLISEKIDMIQRISKPGRRVYKKAGELRPVRNGFGMSIISTSHGLMTGDDAQVKKVGGEVLCEIF